MITPFGKCVRKLRIDRNMLLKDMADRLQKSSAYLSAVESGRKPVPPQLVEDIAAALHLNLAEKAELVKSADESQGVITIQVLPEADLHARSMVAMLARRFNTGTLNPAQVQKIEDILKEGN